MPPIRPLGGLLIAALAALALPSAARALTFKPCQGLPSVRCTTVTVPLDRSGVDRGQVPLRVARLPASRSRPTLMYLSGGPGSAGVSEMASVIGSVPQLALRYRVVGFDQRGTGYSGLLRCPEIEKDPRLRSSTAGARCARRLGAARRHYTTADSVEDMEAIRRALGVEKLTLFGISYGTELALEYARVHPDRVARLILDSTVNPDDRDPYFTVGFRAMAPSLRALCPGRCRGIAADPASDLATLVARLRAHPARAVVYDARARAHRVRVSPTRLADLMFDSDYNPPLRAALPAAVRAALAGDLAPVARLSREGDLLAGLPGPREFSTARYATICEETPLPWTADTPMEQRAAASRAGAAALGPEAFFPFDPPVAAEDEIGLCMRWPGVPRPVNPLPGGPYPAVPTLLLQGGEDLRTPPESSERVAAAIPGAKRLVVPGVGHAIVGGDPSGCGIHALLLFVADRRVPATCPRVHSGVPAVLAPPASFSALRGRPGLSGRVGRTVSGLDATLDDVLLLLSPAMLDRAGGGLRGGSWAIHSRSLVLRRFAAVRGMEVTGRSSSRGLRLRVGGSRAAHGTVVIFRGRVRGTLGGRRISATLRTGIQRSTAAATAVKAAASAAARARMGVPGA